MIFLFSEELVSNQPDGEVEHYIVYTGDLVILNSLPMMKQIFVKLNMLSPSSASDKRLFSVAGDFVKKRAKITDQNFENTSFISYIIYKNRFLSVCLLFVLYAFLDGWTECYKICLRDILDIWVEDRLS